MARNLANEIFIGFVLLLNTRCLLVLISHRVGFSDMPLGSH